MCYWLCHRKISLSNFKNYFWISRTDDRILYECKMTSGNSTEFQMHHELRVCFPSFSSWRKFCSSGNPDLKAKEQETVAQVGKHASHPALSPPVEESGWEFLPNCCQGSVGGAKEWVFLPSVPTNYSKMQVEITIQRDFNKFQMLSLAAQRLPTRLHLPWWIHYSPRSGLRLAG